LAFGVAQVLAATQGADALAEASAVERGKYLLYAGGCIACHTDKPAL